MEQINLSELLEPPFIEMYDANVHIFSKSMATQTPLLLLSQFAKEVPHAHSQWAYTPQPT